MDFIFEKLEKKHQKEVTDISTENIGSIDFHKKMDLLNMAGYPVLEENLEGILVLYI